MKIVEGLTCAFVHEIQKRYAVIVNGSSAILGCIVRHAASVYNRFMLKPSSCTPVEELRLIRHDSPVIAFGANTPLRRAGQSLQLGLVAGHLAWQGDGDKRAHRGYSGWRDQGEDGGEATRGVAVGERPA